MGKTSVEISGVVSTPTTSNVIISSYKSGDLVPFFKEEAYSVDNASFIRFIKNVESQVRTSKEYKAYIKYLKEELDPPLNHCMVYSQITDSMAPIEMHHGPIFTLFDYVEIVMNWCWKNQVAFSSSKIYHLVMEEHRLNNVQIVMLSEAVHKAVHNTNKGQKPRFLDYKMAHGDVVSFLNKYYSGLTFQHIGKLKSYTESYEENSGKSEGFFDEFITKWNQEIMV